jgi:hypothetical protein
MLITENKPIPIISWYRNGDPCLDIQQYKVNNKLPPWMSKLTDINIIHTKTLSDDFINFCIQNKHRIFLHINITGLNTTIFEPNIPSVKTIFMQMKKLLLGGFLVNRILVEVNPIIPNKNGLEALKLILRLFTEFRELRLRFIRFQVLQFTKENNIFNFKNENIAKRKELIPLSNMLINQSETFWKDYNKLLNDYSAIISVDKGMESIIGIRELMAFGYKNEYTDSIGIRRKIISYTDNNRYKPIVNNLSGKWIRCHNKCLLCPCMF